MSNIPTAVPPNIPRDPVERLAYNKVQMAAVTAAHGKSNSRNWAPGSGCIQTPETAKHTHERSQGKAAAATIAEKLTPAEIIQADYAGRTIARKQAAMTGKTLSDFDLQQAGRAMVESKAGVR